MTNNNKIRKNKKVILLQHLISNYCLQSCCHSTKMQISI